jgi:hypothetical protein
MRDHGLIPEDGVRDHVSTFEFDDTDDAEFALILLDSHFRCLTGIPWTFCQ